MLSCLRWYCLCKKSLFWWLCLALVSFPFCADIPETKSCIWKHCFALHWSLSNPFHTRASMSIYWSFSCSSRWLEWPPTAGDRAAAKASLLQSLWKYSCFSVQCRGHWTEFSFVNLCKYLCIQYSEGGMKSFLSVNLWVCTCISCGCDRPYRFSALGHCALGVRVHFNCVQETLCWFPVGGLSGVNQIFNSFQWKGRSE